MECHASVVTSNKGPASHGAKERKDAKAASLAKYNLRTKSIQNRIEVERRKNEPRHPKPKQKPAPLSKYRRRTANFRERCRMQEMNDAFKRLQSAVPEVFSGEDHTVKTTMSAAESKATKINTLKLAVNYISALTQMLNQNESSPVQSLTTTTNIENQSSSRNHVAGKSKPCQTAVAGPSTSSSICVASQTEHSRYKDLSASACQLSPFEFTSNQSISECGHLSATNKVIYPKSSSCEISPFYQYTTTGHLPSRGDHPQCGHQLPDTSSLFTPSTTSSIHDSSHCSSSTFDLSYSLITDGQVLLDDFSAIIDDLQEDSFSLVDELID